jgi:hypothetical protein
MALTKTRPVPPISRRPGTRMTLTYIGTAIEYEKKYRTVKVQSLRIAKSEREGKYAANAMSLK